MGVGQLLPENVSVRLMREPGSLQLKKLRFSGNAQGVGMFEVFGMKTKEYQVSNEAVCRTAPDKTELLKIKHFHKILAFSFRKI